MKNIYKYFFLGLVGGTTYYFCEILYRGYSHISMVILGSVCFIVMGLINELLSWQTPLWEQAIIGGICTTILEFITGCIVNLWLGLNVWHYDILDILGQISLPFFFIWCGLSVIGIILDDYLRYWFLNEEKPRYKLF